MPRKSNQPALWENHPEIEQALAAEAERKISDIEKFERRLKQATARRVKSKPRLDSDAGPAQTVEELSERITGQASLPTKQQYVMEEEIARLYHRAITITEVYQKALRSAQLELNLPEDLTHLTKDQKIRWERAHLQLAKTIIRQLEHYNRTHVFLFKSYGKDWWKLGGNSVVIYQIVIGSVLSREIRVNVDTDNFAHFPEGIICMRGLSRIEGEITLAGAQMVLDDDIKFGPFAPYIKAYRLTKVLPPGQIRRFKKLDHEIIDKVNGQIFPATPETELHNHMVKVMRESYRIEKQISSGIREIFKHTLMDGVYHMRRAYLDVANLRRNDARRIDKLEEVDSAIGDTMITMANYLEIGVIDRKRVTTLSMELAKTREIVEQKITQYRGKHAITEILDEHQ